MGPKTGKSVDSESTMPLAETPLPWPGERWLRYEKLAGLDHPDHGSDTNRPHQGNGGKDNREHKDLHARSLIARRAVAVGDGLARQFHTELLGLYCRAVIAEACGGFFHG